MSIFGHSGPAPASTVQMGEARRSMIRRWRLFGGCFLIYLAYGAQELLANHSRPTIALGLAIMAVFVYVYLIHVPSGTFMDRRRDRQVSLVVLPSLTVIYLAVIGVGGLIFLTFLAVTLVMMVREKYSIPIVLLIVAASTALPQYVSSWNVEGLQWSVSGPVLLVTFAMIGLRRGNTNTMALYQARHEIEQLAAEQERMRIARDLHDLLGHALTTVTVKAELAARLALRDPQQAQREMDDVAKLARQGLADVRAAVTGYRSVSLITELANGREVLRAAGMEPEFPASSDVVPSERRELFGWVVREGITNAVRHSRATRVAVHVQPDRIEVVDDGIGASHGVPGSGLSGLRERVMAAGGSLETGPADNGGFRLSVEVLK